ncbi:hypothetical protein [Roseomonas harenae]|uniref:hypothetical protein n=1 Tax=Muricoccus harenae TaxID=2692566 RepID=UPI0013314BE5|nr:hypothetical protein [Roseomonas harenae]
MVEALRKARQRLMGFLLRHGRSYDGKRWTWPHRKWLMEQTLPHPAQQVACQEYLDAVNELEARIERLTGRIRDLVPCWSMAPVVEALFSDNHLGRCRQASWPVAPDAGRA